MTTTTTPPGAMPAATVSPRESLDTLAQWGTDNLTRVIAIDSQSDEGSDTIPSSAGQRVLSDFLREYFRDLGYETTQDNFANLLVEIPANLGPNASCPAVAFMVHMDTSAGTQAVPALNTTRAWDGTRIPYPDNQRLSVTAANYPEMAGFVGEDVLYGPGRFPIGLDDKLGMAELMTMARVLQSNPEIPHGEVLLVFRPDEEIGRMAAVEGLADELARRGVSYGYTADGITPFEINVENFYASRGRVTIAGTPLRLPDAGVARRLTLAITGVNTHGATAKAEGYCNSTVIVARAVDTLGVRDDIVPVDFQSDAALECNAEVSFLVRGANAADLDRAEAALLDAIRDQVGPHAWKGAGVEVAQRVAAAPAGTGESDGAMRLVAHLQRFLATPGVSPVLSEDSDGFAGYSNPHYVTRDSSTWVLDYRLRDFDSDGLTGREDHLQRACAGADPGGLPVTITRQYINMGPKLKAYPELVTWAEEALNRLGRSAVSAPIRGGTGVDPFLERNIPVANLGTGYFAPESEKECTSRQNIARHSLWFVYLLQVIAAHPPAKR